MRISDWSSDVCSSDLGVVIIILSLFCVYLCAVDRPDAGQIFGGVGAGEMGFAFEQRAAFKFGVPLAGKAAEQSPRRLIVGGDRRDHVRSEEHTSELQSLMRISYAVFCLKKKKTHE